MVIISPEVFFSTFVIVLGAIFGSFFNVCIYRIPNHLSIMWPASHCPVCNTPLKPWNNIPILSYLFQRGKCSYCGAKIHWHYVIVEIITPIVFFLIFYKSDFKFTLFFAKNIFFFSIAIILFFIDSFHKILPDILTIPLIFIGFIFTFFAKDISIINSLLSSIIVFAILYLISYIYYKSTNKIGLGGGDIKLFSAIGAFFGFQGVVFILFFSSVLAVFWYVFSKMKREDQLPFGPFIIFAAFLFFLFGNNIIQSYLNLFL